MTALQSAIDTFRQAAQLNLEDPIRQGSLLCFPSFCHVVMTGDLHGHRRNFEKLVSFCGLEHTPIRHVVLHELIHSEPVGFGADRSIELLLDAAQWKTFFPEQVHFLQSNHELAQLQGHDITKGGRLVTDDFERGIAEIFGTNRIEPLIEAMNGFIASFPLAGRTPNRIWLSHTLPDAADMDRFDPTCVNTPAEKLDLAEESSAYQLVWGRQHTAAMLERLAKAWSVDHFIVGHQPQEFGYDVRFERMLILSSDHNHGVFLPLDCSKHYTIEQLKSRIRPMAAVG